jgi:hypothetical protein
MWLNWVHPIDIIGSTNFKWISKSLSIFILLRFYHQYHYITSLDDKRGSHLSREWSADLGRARDRGWLNGSARRRVADAGCGFTRLESGGDVRGTTAGSVSVIFFADCPRSDTQQRFFYFKNYFTDCLVSDTRQRLF